MFAEMLEAAGACALVVMAAFGLGGWVLPRRAAGIGGLELAALRILAGLGLLGVGLFLVGLVRWGLAAVLAVLIPLALAGLWRLIREPVRVSVRKAPYYAVAIAVMVVCAAAAFSRPVGDIGNDAISYHLLGPAQWADLGRIGVILDESLTAFPATVEVLFGAGMLLSNDRFAGLLDVVFAGIFLLQIRGLGARLFPGERIGALAVSLAATMPVVMLFSNNGFVDVAYACFALAAVRYGLEPVAAVSGAFAAGLFCGFAIGTKYPGLLFVALLAVSLLFFPPAGGSFAKRLRFCVVMIGTAGVVGCAWYIRNGLVLGCPIYPIPAALSRFCQSPYFRRPAVLGFDRYILDRGKGLGRGFPWFLALPFTFTYDPAAFQGGGGIGLAPLCFAPAAILALWKDRAVRFLAALGFLFTLVWFVTQQEARFLIPVIGLSAVLAAIGASFVLWQQSGWGRAVSWAVVGVSAAYGGVFVMQAQLPRIASLRGGAAEARWVRTNTPFYDAFAYLNRSPEVKRVLILEGTVPPYYLKKDYVKREGPYGETPFSGDPLAQLGALGITHVLDVESATFHAHFRIGDEKRLRLVFRGNDARVYAVGN